MPVTDDRTLPLCSVRLYYPGQAEPFFAPGLGESGPNAGRPLKWYQPLTYDFFAASTVETNAGGERLLEHLADIGVVCRPLRIKQDTLLNDWSPGEGGTWVERFGTSGAPRVKQLQQIDSSPDLEYSISSRYAFPQNPHFAFTIIPFDTPADHDADTYPPFVRVELGNRQWALEWSKVYGSRLLLWVSGSGWRAVGELPELVPLGNADSGECEVWVRCLRGRILVSTDRGRNYTPYALPGASVLVRRGKCTVRGQGGQLSFGVHQLRYYEATLTSLAKQVHANRLLPTSSVTGKYALPTGTAINFSDTSTPAAGLVQWEAELVPEEILGGPWSFYTTPELYGVRFAYAGRLAGALGTHLTPWDDQVLTVDVDKPEELDGATCTIVVRKDPDTPFEWSFGRWPAVEVLLGHVTEAGAEEWTRVFFGYLRSWEVRQPEHREATLALAVDNRLIRFKRARWSALESAPLGGQTLNAALDEVLASEGLGVDDRLWHVGGDLIMLPEGTAENPAFWPAEDEEKFQTLQDLCRWCGFEITHLDDGRIASFPRNYVEPWVSHVYEWEPTAELTALIQDIALRFDSGESVTGVIIRGEDVWGNVGWAYGIDTGAEWFPLSGRFCPWRELHQEMVPGATTAGFLQLAVQSRFLDLVPLKYEGFLKAPVKLTVGRRQRVLVEGTPTGIGPTDQFGVLRLHHHYGADPSFATLTTEVAFRRTLF